MIARANPMLDELEAALETGVLDSFAAFVRGRAVPSDAELAELIEVDARARLARGGRVELSAYFEAVPALEKMPVALDAAIEFTLRSYSNSNQPEAQAVERLERLFPRLAGTIRNAVALSEGLATTRVVRGAENTRRNAGRALPCAFGAQMRDGRQRFELRKQLGEGSQGVVYLAVDRALSDAEGEALVAIKVLDGRELSQSERWRAMDEATRARRVSHPNVVRVLDRGESDEGEEYIVFEHVGGGDMDSWLCGRDQLTAREAASLVARMSRGVQAAHAAGLVHRDLKPGNVLMEPADADGAVEPKITDFGVAARIGPIDADNNLLLKADAEGRVGNLAFIAPEQYRGDDRAWEATVDVYALGGILYFLLTGKMPNGSNASQIAATHQEVGGRAEAPRLREGRINGSVPGVDEDLEAICRRALSPSLEARYATADAFATDLERWQTLEPISWTRPGIVRRSKLLARRQPKMVAMSVVAAVAVMIGIGASLSIWLTQQRIVMRAQLEADAAGAFATKERTYRDRVSVMVRAMNVTIAKSREQDIAADWFPTLTIMESLTGPYIFDPRSVGTDPWSNKLHVASTAIRAAVTAGHPESLEALLWSDTLAFWLLRSGEYKRAEGFLKNFDAGWDKLLGADDPWRITRRTLHAAADALRLEDKANDGHIFGSDDAELRETERVLVESERYFRAEHLGDTLHRFVVGCLIRIYDPKLLDDPVKLDRANRLADEIRNVKTSDSGRDVSTKVP